MGLFSSKPRTSEQVRNELVKAQADFTKVSTNFAKFARGGFMFKPKPEDVAAEKVKVDNAKARIEALQAELEAIELAG